MEIYIIKNVLKNVLYFLEYSRSFIIKDDPHNFLDLFLVELNRLRQMINLQPFVLEKVIKTSNGALQKKFSLSKAQLDNKDKVDNVDVGELKKSNVITITKTKFTNLMEELYGDNLTVEITSILNEESNKEFRSTIFYLGDIEVGAWSGGRGTYSN